jgi:hypothetical protein
VATTRTEDGHKYNTKTSATIPRINQKDEETEDNRGRDGGTNFILRIKEQETRLILHEYEYNDDDDHNGLLEDVHNGVYRVQLIEGGIYSYMWSFANTMISTKM